MPLWKIVPITDVDDARWLDHPVWQEVVVRAPTSAHARVLASDMEFKDIAGEAPAGNESLSFSSGFEDEKLYQVRRLEPGQEPGVAPEGREEVIRAVRAPVRAIETRNDDQSAT